jgi:hypothetical protein
MPTTSSPESGSAAAAPKQTPAKPTTDKDSPFYVPPLVHVLGGLVHRHRRFWLWLGRLESGLLGHDLQQVPVKMPIFVSGLARSGSSLLHEVVSSHPAVATHRIKDYPMVFTPYWWRRATARSGPQVPRERPHKDGMMVTLESPDAIEEVLWMAFFPRCHDPSVSNLVAADEQNPAFEAFYPAHIRKLLFAEGATRYAAKNNYHVMRLPYLVRLFPDAKFLIPIRAPAGHIGSLIRQHQWFSKGHRENPKSLAVMQRSGHFEFGLDRRPMNLGDGERVKAIVKAWEAGDEVRGLAIYWDMVYGYVHRLLETDPKVRAATMVVRFETTCEAPAETLRKVLAHCQLPDPEPIVAKHAPGIRFPTYYKSDFTQEQQEVIRQETAATARLFGY